MVGLTETKAKRNESGQVYKRTVAIYSKLPRCSNPNTTEALSAQVVSGLETGRDRRTRDVDGGGEPNVFLPKKHHGKRGVERRRSSA